MTETSARRAVVQHAVRARRGSASPRAGCGSTARTDGIDWIDVITKNGECFGAVSRMGVARAPRRAGQPRSGRRGGRRRGRLRRSDRRAHGRVGEEPARQGDGLQQEPDRGVLPGGPDPAAHTMTPQQLLRLRGLLPLPQDRRGGYAEIVRWDGAIGELDVARSGASASEFGVEGRRRDRGDDRGQRPQGLHQRRGGDLGDRRQHTATARRESASTSASPTPTSTTASRSFEVETWDD